MLEPWALSRSSHKKRLMRLIFQDAALKRSACLHALCEPEATHIRSLGLKNPIAIVPNGILLADYQDLPDKSVLAQKYPHLKDQKLILFLSRLHPKKGVLHLLDAWGQMAQEFKDWHLVIAGPDENNHQAEIVAKIQSAGITERTTLTGMIAGSDKLAVLAAADIFVLPSFSEGFSMAILEAMACRLPVLLTPGCNFPEAVQAKAAIEGQPDAPSTAAGLRTLLEMTDAERGTMGLQGYNLVAANYTWKRIASNFIQLYEWCIGGGTPPTTVRLHDGASRPFTIR
jgi:glycosyltransferase involved in cell wall biosynthesis